MDNRLSSFRPSPARGLPLDIYVYYSYNTPTKEDEAMFDNPVAKRTAIAAGIGALIAIPVPFVGPIFGALAGGAFGFFTAGRR